jgi:hypothetical protein
LSWGREKSKRCLLQKIWFAKLLQRRETVAKYQISEKLRYPDIFNSNSSGRFKNGDLYNISAIKISKEWERYIEVESRKVIEK